jgi:hypothetical protein
MDQLLKSRVNVGMTVRTVDGKAIGRVTTLHGDTFEIEKGVFFNRDYCASFDEVARVDGSDVVLTVSAGTLDAMRAPGAVGTAFADRASGVVDHARAALDEAVHLGHPSTRRPS